MRDDLKAKVWQLITAVSGVAIERVHDRALLKEDLGFDSLDAIDLRNALECEFGVDLPDRVFDGARTVDDVVTLTRTAESLAVAELRQIARDIGRAAVRHADDPALPVHTMRGATA